MPVIVEDDVLVGGNTGIYEGAVIKQRAVIAAGTVLTGSTPVYDLVNGAIIKPAAGQPLVVPAGRGGGAGRARGDRRRRQGVGTVAGHAGDREVSRRQDGRAHGARRRGSGRSTVALHARSWSTSNRRPATKARSAAWLAGIPSRSRLFGAGAAAGGSGPIRAGMPRVNVIAAVGEPRGGVLHALRLRAAVLSQPHRRRRALWPRRVRREGHSRRASRGRGAAARGRRDAHRPGVRGRRGARQRRREGREPHRLEGEVPDQRRADRAAARRRDARRVSRALDGPRQGRALRLPGARRIGDRQADRLPGRAARRGLAVGSAARPDASHRGFDQRRRRAECDLTRMRKRKCSFGPSAITRRCARRCTRCSPAA